jgi:hypothetical protein
MAPGPPAGSGPHRYQLILLDAPTSHIITEPDDRCAFNVQDLITDNDLCDSQVATFQFSAKAAWENNYGTKRITIKRGSMVHGQY